MAVETVPPPPRRRSFFRVWLPLLIVALYAAALTAVWTWPDPDWARVYRVVSTSGLTMLTLLLLGLWFVAFSGLRWWVRLAGVALGAAAVVVLPAALIRETHFSGDMVPVIRFRWDSDPTRLAFGTDSPAAALPPLTGLAGDRPTDYPGYRGARRDGVVEGPELTAPRPVWRHPCGGGYAGFAVAGNALVTIEQRGDREAVVCYDTETGGQRWVHDYPAHFKEQLGGDGPRATPTIADGAVYSVGATGKLVRLDAATGKLAWERDILEDNANIQWGMSGSPLVYDRFVVVNPGNQKKTAVTYGAVTAFDRQTGEPVWNAGDTRAGYSSPMLATLAGKRQVLLFDGEGIGGYDADKGTGLWHIEWKTNQGINVAQPIVLPGDRVFVCSGYEVGCDMLKVTQGGGEPPVKSTWGDKKNRKMRCQFTSPVADDRFLYGLDMGVLVCLDQATGERKWRGERYGHGQLLRTGGQLLILAEDGDLALVRATGDGPNEVWRVHALEGKTWNYPALAGGRAYVRNDHEMACYDLTPPEERAGNRGDRSPGPNP
jgi:outer membrane protein assembly factor BamB